MFFCKTMQIDMIKKKNCKNSSLILENNIKSSVTLGRKKKVIFMLLKVRIF